MRYLGGFNAPSYNPLAANVTTGVTTVQQGGVFTSSSAAQNIPLGQWLNDQYFNRNVLLLQADNATNGSQNNTFLDSSTNNFTVTRNGNTTQGSFSPFANPNGYWSNYFDGSGDYLTVTGSSNLAFGSGNFTIELFIYFTSVASQQIFYDARPSGTTSGAYTTIFFNTTLLKLSYFVNGTDRIVSDSTPVANQWYHIAVTRNGTTTRMFINGVQQGAAIFDNTTYLNGASRPTIGCSGDSIGSGPTFGYISNLRVLNGTALYTANFIPPTSPSTAITNTQLLTCQSNRFVDNSTNAYVVTKTGDTSVRPIIPFSAPAYTTSVSGGGMYFDGTGDNLVVVGNSNLAFGSNNFTIECFVYPTSAGVSSCIMYDSRPAGTAAGAYALLYIVTSNLKIAYNVGATVAITSDAIAPLNSWTHVVVSRVSGTTRMFINGAVQSQTYTDSSTYLNGTNRPISGTDGNSPNNSNFFGYISNLRVLNGTGVTSVTVPTTPLTAITNTQLLLSGTNAGIYDATTQNNFETVGNAQVSTAIKKYGSGSMYFDGTGDWLLIPDSFELRLGAGNFTVEAWIYVSSFASPRSIIGKGTGSTGWFLYVATTGKLAFGYDASTLNGNNALVLNTWNHVALVRFGSLATNVKMYINGNLDVSSGSAITQDFNQTNNMYVGADRSAGNNFFGYIDDLRVTKNLARYTTNFVPPTVALPRMG